MKKKCDVCGKEEKVVVCASSCGPVSLAYCKECLHKGIEPYGILVSYLGSACISSVKDIRESYLNQMVMPTLNHFGKTIEDLESDLKKEEEKMNEYYDSLQPCEEVKSTKVMSGVCEARLVVPTETPIPVENEELQIAEWVF